MRNRGMTENIDLAAPQPALLRELYFAYAASNTQPALSIKTSALINPIRRYVQLNNFREQMEAAHISLTQGPYSKHVTTVSKYKKTFLCFSIFFFILWVIAFIQSMVLPYPFYKGPFGLSNVLLLGSSFSLAILSYIMFRRLRPEKEAAMHTIRKAQNKLHAIYRRKHLIKGWKSLFSFRKHDRKSLLFQERYDEAKKILTKRYEDAVYLINRIVKSHKLDGEQKEVLLNQALLELEDSYQLVLSTFHNSFFLAQC